MQKLLQLEEVAVVCNEFHLAKYQVSNILQVLHNFGQQRLVVAVVKQCHLRDVFNCGWVVLGNDPNQAIRRVLELREGVADLLKVITGLLSTAVVNDPSLSHEVKSVEVTEGC